jgi:glycosyltransferase involved in cell wall biosynthesis
LEQKDILPSEYEIIIVDDGSPDNSIMIAEQSVKNYPVHIIKFVTRKNGGLSAARNTGMSHATGKYVWFVDSDDYIEEDALAQLKNQLNELKEGVDVLVFRHRTVYVDGKISEETVSENYLCTGFEYLRHHTFLSVWTGIYNNEFLKKNNFHFKEGVLWEDSEFNLRVYGVAGKLYFLSKSLYFYVRRENSITTKGMSFEMMNSWFENINSVNRFYKDKKLRKWENQVINTYLARMVIGCIAGFKELSNEDYSFFREKLLSDKKNYLNLFSQSGKISVIMCGFLVLYCLPIAEFLLAFLMRRAINRGEGR